jgi:hypothetical protein
MFFRSGTVTVGREGHVVVADDEEGIFSGGEMMKLIVGRSSRNWTDLGSKWPPRSWASGARCFAQ